MTFVSIGANLPEVEVAWSPTTAPQDVPVYSDLNAYVRDSLQIRRGRVDELARFETATLSGLLDNRDRRFDPTFAGVLTNLVTNPSFETNVALWTATGNVIPTKTQSTAQAFVGSASMRLQATTTATNQGVGAYADPIAAAPGDRVSFQAQVFNNNSGGGTRQWFIDVYFRDGSGVDVAAVQQSAAVVAPFNQWTSLSFQNVLVPASTVNIFVEIIELVAATGVGVDYYVDAVQVEKATAASAYIDGSLDAGRWAGTPHASQSYRGGPYYPNVKALRRVRVRARWNSVIYDRFVGFLDEELAQQYPNSGHDAVVPFQAFDGLGVLAMAHLPLAFTRTAEQTGARVNAVLDAVGWPAGDRSIATGIAEIAALDAGTDRTALQHLADVEDAENGHLFVDRSGNLVFQDRHYRNLSERSSRQTFATVAPAETGLHYEDCDVRYGGRLYNHAQVTPASGEVQEHADTASQADYYPRSFSKSLPMSSDADALALAQWVVNFNKQPTMRCLSAKFAPAIDPSTMLPALLGLEISHHVTMRVTPPALTGTYVFEQAMEGFEETISVGRDWRIALQMSPIDLTSYWTLGTSTLGVDTTLGY